MCIRDRDIVLLGNLTQIPQGRDTINTLNNIFKVNFMVPDRSQFGTVIGAALAGLKHNKE